MASELQKFNNQLDTAPNIKSMFMLPVIQQRFIANYEKTTGHKDGKQRFEQVIFDYLALAQENKDLMKADRFSIYAAIIKAGTTGLLYRDGHLYPVVYKYDGGNKLIVKTQIGAHGKREMLMRMPTIEFVGEAQLVLKGDKFNYDNINRKVSEHTWTLDEKRVVDEKLNNVLAVYVPIDFKNRHEDVLVLKDEIVKSKGQAKTMKVWNAFPGEMCKKVGYNRAFKLYHRYPEGQVLEYAGYDDDGDYEPADVQEEEPTTKPTPEKTEKPKTEKPKPEQKEEPLNVDAEISDAEVVDEEKSEEGIPDAY